MNLKLQLQNGISRSISRDLFKLLFFIAILFRYEDTYALGGEDGQKFSLKEMNVAIGQVMSQIEEESDYVFFYNKDIVDTNKKVSIDVRDASIDVVLEHLFEDGSLSCVVKGDQIVIKKRKIKVGPAANSTAKISISGVVVDEDNIPIIGVTVFVKNSTQGTTTDIKGSYTLNNVDTKAEIAFSFIGYELRELSAKSAVLNTVVLREELNKVDEVVVVGYTTRAREKITSSVASISGEKLVKSSAANLENALSGRISGVYSRQNSSEPGSDGSDIKIRGFGSALIVVDGIPGRDYSHLDPSEIESISVLKDAAAASVYGMQGANGVILVTTKRGGRNKATAFDVSLRFGSQTPHNFPETASSNMWQTLVNEYYANETLIANPSATIPAEKFKIKEYAHNTNWQDVMMQNALVTQSNVNVSGGSDKINYFISGGLFHQGGIWASESTKQNRFNFRSNIDANLTDNFKISTGVGFVLNQLDYPGTSSAEIARSIKLAAPNIPIRWPGHPDNYAYNGEGTDNPMALTDSDVSGYSESSTSNLNIDLSLDYKVAGVDGLSLKATFGYTLHNGWSKNWDKNIVYTGYREGADEYYQSKNATNLNKASLSLADANNYNAMGQGFINYIQGFNGHNINTGVVFEISQGKNRGFGTGRGDFSSDILDMIAGGNDSKLLTNWESLREYRSASIIGRFAYDYESKYFVDFNFRYDGAQYFADKWGFFPSASVGWMVSKEPFMEPLQDVVSEFKLRASYGKLGDLSSAKDYYNNNEQYYFQSGYLYPGNSIMFGDRLIYGVSETIHANPYFTWSTSTIANVGFDFSLWKGKLKGSAEYFYRQRDGLPAKKANDNAGALSTWYNLNGDSTRGFDLSLGFNDKIGELSYYIDGNLSWSRTKNSHIEHGQFTSGYDSWKYNGEYQWTNVRWGYKVVGRYENADDIKNALTHVGGDYTILPGDLKYEDYNSDGYIDNKDIQPIGRTAYPELMYGITVGASWKGIDFTMFWQGGALCDFEISTFDRHAFMEGKTDNNTWDYFSDRWHKTDYSDASSEWTPGHFPAIRDMNTPSINTLPSDFWLFDGNYIRLKNIELGYTMPKQWFRGAKISSVRLYVSANNCLTISSQNFLDPEQAESYFSFASYPQVMSFNFGANIKF